MRHLTLTLPRGQDESLASHFSRVAALHGQPSASAFASVFGISFRKVAAGVMPDVYKAAAALGETPVSVDPALTRYHNKRLSIRGHLFTRDLACVHHRRFCPSCIREDEAQGTGRHGLRAYGRLTWLPRFVQVCPVHQTTFVNFDPIDRYQGPDFALHLRSSRTSLTEYSQRCEPGKVTDFQRFVIARLNGETPGYWFDAVPLQALGHLATVVGMLMRRQTKVSPRKDEKVIRDCAPEGFALLASGKSALRDFLASVITRNYTPRRKLSSLIIYRELASEMVFHREVPGYREVIRMMQDVACEILPLGPNDPFFEPITRRNLHSIHTASKEFEIPYTVLWETLEVRGLVPKNLDPWTAAKMTFEADTIAEVARSLLANGFAGSEAQKRFTLSTRLASGINKANFVPAEWLSTAQATFKLGILDQSVTAVLVDDGYLTEIEAPTPHAVTRIRKADIEKFRREYVLEPSWFPSVGITPAIAKHRVGMNMYSRDSYTKASLARSA
ncbi:hypothetical protein N183_14780 [Sinorhizobium sp. Sb3]|uniref:TniQ family protein n=1 Tax=Sinorhizobium sp. Sb3 TaxID=1358417 RepID=UPI00071E046B|nr:TniQ family protein [Sinorhizobium sp. Sb3]KSV81775.1 hypothetical protein N183_14780 [Sinorhizobium sp. Sb3]